MDITPSTSTQCTREIEEANELIGQLPDILEKIFSHLNAQGLSRAATVNKLWNDLAMHELDKRGLQVMFVPTGNVYDVVETKPLVTVLFVNSRDLQNDKCKEDLLMCEDSFPNHVVVVPARLLMMNEEKIFYSGCQSRNGMISLLFPQYRDLKIRTSSDKELFKRMKPVIDYSKEHDFVQLDETLLDEILPEDSMSKATFIMFGPPDRNYNRILLSLEQKMEKRRQQYVLWGVDFQTPPCAFSDPSYRFCTNSRGFFAMSITGSSLESSSIILSCDIKKREFDRKLLDFRSQLRLKRHSIGFLCGPVRNPNESKMYYSPTELAATVRRIFPNAPLIGTFDHFWCYGSKSKTADPNRLLEHLFSFSFMILTYD